MAAVWSLVWPGVLAVMTLGFAVYAFEFGWRGTLEPQVDSRLFSSHSAANTGIFLHMMSGAVITVLAPLQLISPVRTRAPALHRFFGRTIVLLALVTAAGGLIYIGLHGTIGGADMSASFALYGLAMGYCAIQTFRHARAKRWRQHADWALRLFVLCIASWIYRVHYGLWTMLFGRSGINSAQFDGLFDLVNIWAFFILYLALLETWFARNNRGFFKKGLRQ